MKEINMSNKWMEKLTKEFGKAAADMPKPSEHVVALPSPSMNWVVGNGGVSRGKCLTLYGPESSGKSLLAQLVLIQLQKDFPDGICVWFDAEYSFNPEWFAKLGGDQDRLLVRQTNDPLKIFDWIGGEMNQMIQDGCPIVGIAIDSVKAIRYPRDHKKETTKQVQGGSGAAYLGSAFKLILPVIRENNVTTVLVQQVYEEMDEYKKMNNPFIVPDGRSLKHFSDYMLEVTRIDTKDGRVEAGKNIYGGNQQIGHKVRIKGKKNRVGAPFRVGEFTLNYTRGIVNVGEEIYELAKSVEVVRHPINPDTGKANPQMWQFADHPAIRGEENMKAWVAGNTLIQDEIMKACYSIDDDNVLKARNEALGIIDINIEDAFE
jgi:recombination protein RecA